MKTDVKITKLHHYHYIKHIIINIINITLNQLRNYYKLIFLQYFNRDRHIKNIIVIKYSKIKDFKKIAECGFGIIYEAIWKINSRNGVTVAVKKF